MAIPSKNSRFLRWRPALISLSGVECLAISTLYLLRPDWAAAATIFPFWLWAIPGILAAVAAVPPRSARVMIRWRRAVLIAWGIALFSIAEEPRSLLKPVGSLDHLSGLGKLRIISLNCAGGDPTAAQEVVKLRPDIVLLQETPVERHIKLLAESIWGSQGHYLMGMDTSILARVPLQRIEIPRDLRGSFVCAKPQFDGGPAMELISLRLTAGLLQWDLWNPSCWAQQTQNRQIRRNQLTALLPHLRSISRDTSVILGGDFNAPQGDPVIGLLGPQLQDAFTESGRGWGNTISNELPLLRIDQVWLGRELHAARTFALETVHSDHRMVVVDLESEL